MTHAEKEVRNQKIVELRKQGYSMNQIADMFDLTPSAIACICKRYGVAGVMSDRKATYVYHPKLTEKQKREYVEKFLPLGFSYDSGYIDCDHHLMIRCNVCNSVFDASMITIRKGNKIECKACNRAAKQYFQEQIKLRKDAERQKKKIQRQKDLDAEHFAKTIIVQCVECGKVFSTYNSNRVCCSPECTKHRANRRHDRRIAKDKRIDNITVNALYNRDNGICWICKKQCDLNDYIIKNKAIVCGDNYPSIDHIVPVCNGGADEWANVKLAHRKCNLYRFIKEKHSPVKILSA